MNVSPSLIIGGEALENGGDKTEPCKINKKRTFEPSTSKGLDHYEVVEDSVKEPALVSRSELASFPCESRMNRSNAAG